MIWAIVAGVLIVCGGFYYWYGSVMEKEEVKIKKDYRYIAKDVLKRSGKESIAFYLGKLADPNYVSTYGHGYKWFIAAEELGQIGKLAIPGLIKKLDTKNDYERTQAIYALRLAAQHNNVKAFTGGEYVKITSLAFPPPEKHRAVVGAWKSWYEKYKSNWE
ncbi:MAG: hypothetical protein HQ596_07720 [Candidatus Saganbacteria bacterium]|nr:hypothetical protein [Candidatus Saganbacteria bacterium]